MVRFIVINVGIFNITARKDRNGNKLHDGKNVVFLTVKIRAHQTDIEVKLKNKLMDYVTFLIIGEIRVFGFILLETFLIYCISTCIPCAFSQLGQQIVKCS